MRIFLTILISLFSLNVYATQIVTPTSWSNGDTVTAAKLNGNQNAITNVVNGSIDNTNMASGYRLFQIVSSLPSPGNQGNVAFLTSNNTLNLDNGSAWLSTVTPSGSLATGQIPYYNSGWQLLNPGTNKYALISNGVSSLPSYQQVDLAAGVTGNLSVTNLGNGTGASSSTFWRGDATWVAPSTPSYSSVAGNYANGSYLIFGPGVIVQGPQVSYTKMFEVILPRAGTFTTIVGGAIAAAHNSSHVRIYRNGSAIGTEQTIIANTWTNFTENISGWAAGDLLQVYADGDNTGIKSVVGGLRVYENVPVKEAYNPSIYPNQNWWQGFGVPDPALGIQGDIYTRTDGITSTTLYVKTGVSTWTAK